ncbi:ABC-type branched-chain amino acid transport system periplasmic protein [Acidovorax sp. KKS102]|nr:ABC-type branched-chain amino acid transport system periplasmic protein [Acidovorax sp. KKS102]
MAVCATTLIHARNEGVTANEIRLGASVVLSGPLGPQTAQYGEGSRLLFDAVNAQGGVHGRMIRYTTLDDAFDPQKAVENTRQLLENDKVFMIFHSTGTAQTAAILPLIKEQRTLLFGPVTGASVFRETFNPYVFHVRAGYANEASKIVSQLRQQGNDPCSRVLSGRWPGQDTGGRAQESVGRGEAALPGRDQGGPQTARLCRCRASNRKSPAPGGDRGHGRHHLHQLHQGRAGHGSAACLLRVLGGQHGRDPARTQGQGAGHHPGADHAFPAQHHHPGGGSNI